MPQFDIETFPAQIFWLILFFSAFYLLISKIIAPRLESILNSRSKILEDNILAAKEYQTELEALENYKNKELVSISKNSKSLKEKALKTLDAKFIAKRAKIENEISEQNKQAQMDIKKFADEFMLEQQLPSLNLARNIISKATGKKPDEKILKLISSKV